jgi:integrase/recombinase XerD
MSNLRQLPLFGNEPQKELDLTRYTPIKYTLPLFEQHLWGEGKTEHTIKAFLGDIALFTEYVNPEIPVGNFQTRHLEQFLNWMENERGVSCSRKTYARRVTTLKVFFKWLRQIDAIGHDPAKAVVQRSGEAPLSYALNPLEVRRVIAFAQAMKRKKGDLDTRPETLFRLLLDTGIKKNEAMRLTVADIHREDAQHPYVHVHQTAQNVYKERKLTIDPSWLTLFDLYCTQYDIKNAIFTCTARNLEYILADLSVGAGLEVQISFEIMRWTTAVRDARSGVDENLIREKLGLSRISWTETSRKIERLLEGQYNTSR